MSRYVDAEWLKADFPHDSDWDYPVNTNSYVVELIDKAPSIEIVRCGECINADFGGCGAGRCYCMEHCCYMGTDDFCSYGKQEGDRR